VRLVILVGLAIDQIAQSGLSSLSVIYYSAQLFRFFQIVAFFKKHPKFDLSVYLGSISVPYMPQKNSPTDK
ncbi:hypothetical protein ACRWTE_23950, partial [Escherichia coli]